MCMEVNVDEREREKFVERLSVLMMTSGVVK